MSSDKLKATLDKYLQDFRVQLLLNMFLGGDIKEITPKFDPAHGYRYPEVETLVKGNFQKSLSFLEELTRAGILKRTLYDTVLFCPKCGSSHLSLRYKCPFCGSYDVGTTSLIEHVHCGNIAREEEYQKGAKMVCPRCHMAIRGEKDIRRVGFWYKCDSCGRNFEVPNMVLFCRMCKESFEHTEVKRVNVYSYSLQDLVKEEISKSYGYIFLAPLRTYLEGLGYHVKSPSFMKGKSGAVHEFQMIFTKKVDSGEEVNVLELLPSPEEEAVIKLYLKVFDVSPTRAILVAVPSLSENAKKLAASYNIQVIEAADLNKAFTQFKEIMGEPLTKPTEAKKEGKKKKKKRWFF